MLLRFFNSNEEEFREFVGALGSLVATAFDTGTEVIKPYHKSVGDWLTNELKAGVYYVSKAEGHRQLADAGFSGILKTKTTILDVEL